MKPFLENLAARRRFGMKPGLETIRALCSALGEPQQKFRAVHVAGTNGKGAVCAILDAALREAGLRVGRYTSPHLVQLNERFFLDGAPVNDETLERLSVAVDQAVSRSADRAGCDLTFFEALTAVAFQLYAEAHVDAAVLECGLGGRLDATNVCRPELCVITRIGLDHCDWLGDTVEKIAAEKAGIVKPGVPVVLGRNDPSVCAVIAARAKEIGAPFHYAPDLVDDAEVPTDFSLQGCFNRENAVTALAALGILSERLGLPRFAPGRLPPVIWPGRFHRIGKFIVDGAHNPPAARALLSALDGETVNLIAGFCGDKDVDTVLSTLAPVVRQGFAVRTNNPRSLSADATASHMRAAGIETMACESLSEALRAAERAGGQTLVCGSLFLAGEALVALGAYPWQGVRFDPSETLKVK